MRTRVGRWTLVFTIQKGPENGWGGRISMVAGGEGDFRFWGLEVNLKEQEGLLDPWSPHWGAPLEDG